jgi:hypothetical protein
LSLKKGEFKGLRTITKYKREHWDNSIRKFSNEEKGTNILLKKSSVADWRLNNAVTSALVMLGDLV